jgi:hypothetical protein
MDRSGGGDAGSTEANSEIAALTALGVPGHLVSAYQTASDVLAAEEAALAALEARVTARRTACAQWRAHVLRAKGPVMNAVHALRVRHNNEGGSLLLKLLEREDTRAQLLQAEYWGVLGLWRLRGVCRALRKWVVPAMLSIRVVAVGGSVLVVADPEVSDHSEETAVATHEVLDLFTMKWSSGGPTNDTLLRPLPEPRDGHAACRLKGGAIVVVGGAGFGLDAPIDNNESKMALQCMPGGGGEWAELPTMPRNRVGAAIVALDDGRVMVFGGMDSVEADLAEDEERLESVVGLDTRDESPTWTLLSPMRTARRGAVAVQLRSGKILVAGGGEDATGDVLRSAELFDPAANAWAPLPSMRLARKNAAACLLPSGRVMVCGGASGDDTHDSCEIFDPVTSRWDSTATSMELHDDDEYEWDEMNYRRLGEIGFRCDRVWHSAVAVPGGLIIAGGHDDDGCGQNVLPCGLYDEGSDRWFTLPREMAQPRAATQMVAVPR